jgi:hypothetical protein
MEVMPLIFQDYMVFIFGGRNDDHTATGTAEICTLGFEKIMPLLAGVLHEDGSAQF